MSHSSSPLDLSTFRLRRRTPGSFILVPSRMEGRYVRCQGHLEADTALVLGACPCVDQFQEQPLRIWYAWRTTANGCQIRLLAEPPERPVRKSTPVRISYIVPDFLVSMASGQKRLLEVKPSKRLDNPIVQRKLAVARLFVSQQGWQFHLLTEQQLCRGCLPTNLRLLRRYQMLHVQSSVVEQILGAIPAKGVSLGVLLRESASPNLVSLWNQHILHLLCLGQLSFDPCSGLLGQDTLLFPQGVVSWDPFLSAWVPNGCSADDPSASCGNTPPTGSSRST